MQVTFIDSLLAYATIITINSKKMEGETYACKGTLRYKVGMYLYVYVVLSIFLTSLSFICAQWKKRAEE